MFVNYDDISSTIKEKKFNYDKESYIEKSKHFKEYVDYKSWTVIILLGIISSIFSLFVTSLSGMIGKYRKEGEAMYSTFYMKFL